MNRTTLLLAALITLPSMLLAQTDSRSHPLSFTVQIGILREVLPEAPFKDIGPLKGEPFGARLTRYTVGSFSELASASGALSAVKKIGYADAFVVALRDGARITLSEARRIEVEGALRAQPPPVVREEVHAPVEPAVVLKTAPAESIPIERPKEIARWTTSDDRLVSAGKGAPVDTIQPIRPAPASAPAPSPPPVASSMPSGDPTLLKHLSVLPQDSTQLRMNSDAVHSRPLVPLGHGISLGGYAEANSKWVGSDGEAQGLSFQLQRLTVLLGSDLSNRLRIISEVELNNSARPLDIVFAALDLELHPLFNLRGGIVLNPSGGFNQNHDGPLYEFTERPLASTTLIPSTWSNAGFGLFGKAGNHRWGWNYEVYLTNGFDNSIIDNATGRTWLAASKDNVDRFTQSSNGIPLVTLKTAWHRAGWGEVGVSWMGGVYNKFEVDGLQLDDKRRVDVAAIDFHSDAGEHAPTVTCEFAWVMVDVPPTYFQGFGSRQRGGYVDVVQSVVHGHMLGWDNARLNLAVRGDYVDYNVGTFNETNGNIADDVEQITGGVGFRPEPRTVLRANYGYRWDLDILGNPATRTTTITFGLSTYF